MGCSASSSIQDVQYPRTSYSPAIKFNHKKIRKSTLDFKKNDYDDGYGECKHVKSHFAKNRNHENDDNNHTFAHSNEDRTSGGYESGCVSDTD